MCVCEATIPYDEIYYLHHRHPCNLRILRQKDRPLRVRTCQISLTFHKLNLSCTSIIQYWRADFRADGFLQFFIRGLPHKLARTGRHFSHFLRWNKKRLRWNLPTIRLRQNKKPWKGFGLANGVGWGREGLAYGLLWYQYCDFETKTGIKSRVWRFFFSLASVCWYVP